MPNHERGKLLDRSQISYTRFRHSEGEEHVYKLGVNVCTPGILWPESFSSASEIQSEFKVTGMIGDLEEMKERIKELESQINVIKNFFEDFPLKIRIIDVKDVSIEKAKDMIYQYYETHLNEAIYPDDIADELGLDLKTTVEAIDLLLEEKKIEEVE